MTTSETVDVIVVGYGDAGASAAIEAADAGAKVLALDRGWGGGASALSGGVVYAGGGTAQQREAGYEDSPENLYAYLKQEVGDAVDEPTLRRFCEQSADTIPWLESQGARFAAGVPPYKTSYPTDDFYLYYSGNEKAWPYNLTSTPAPRGHRALAKGLSSGKVLWTALADSARSKGVDFRPLARVHELIIEDDHVVGVRYKVLDASHPNAITYKKLARRSGKIGNWMPGLVKGTVARMERLWQEGAVEKEARGAVVLAAGGFIYNEQMVAEHAPEFTKISPLGTPADDGTGIRLGVSAGGTISRMGHVTAWRFLSPPSAFIEGVAVGIDGRRIANEDLYGATHGNVMMREHGGRGWAIYDAATWRKAKSQVNSQTQIFQRLQTLYLFTIGHKRAGTLEKLANKTGIEGAGLRRTVDAYNAGILAGEDPAHKAIELCAPVENGPFYAFDISAENAPFFPLPGLTLGGLIVDGATGLVARADGTTIDGLYAAGRNAVGVCSNSYISGLSLADCIFSGRRAGGHAALRVSDDDQTAKETQPVSHE